MTAIGGRDYFMETLDGSDQVVRRVNEGRVKQWLGGATLAWIPDRRPSEARLQVIDKRGTLIARGTLVDNERELG